MDDLFNDFRSQLYPSRDRQLVKGIFSKAHKKLQCGSYDVSALLFVIIVISQATSRYSTVYGTMRVIE